MRYPNLIFINYVLDNYCFDRVVKASKDTVEIFSNAWALITNRSNNLKDVNTKFQAISDKCAENNSIKDPTLNAQAWVSTILLLGKTAELCENHQSHFILHLLRSYLIYCGEDWTELGMQINTTLRILQEKNAHIESALMAKHTPTTIQKLSSSPKTTYSQDEDKDTTDYNALSVEELNKLRDITVREMVYLGSTDFLLRPDINYQRFFPKLSLTEKFKTVENFTPIKSLPLELHAMYCLYYAIDSIGIPLPQWIQSIEANHHKKFGTFKPEFLKPKPTVTPTSTSHTPDYHNVSKPIPIPSSASRNSKAHVLFNPISPQRLNHGIEDDVEETKDKPLNVSLANTPSPTGHNFQ